MCDLTIINRTWMYHDTHGYGWNLAKELATKEVLAEREARRLKIAAKYPPRTSLPRRAKVVALKKIKDITYSLKREVAYAMKINKDPAYMRAMCMYKD